MGLSTGWSKIAFGFSKFQVMFSTLSTASCHFFCAYEPSRPRPLVWTTAVVRHSGGHVYDAPKSILPARSRSSKVGQSSWQRTEKIMKF